MSYVSMGAVSAADAAVSLIALKSKAESAADSIVSNAGFLDKSAAKDWRDSVVSAVSTKIDNMTRRDSTGKYNCERNPSLVKDLAAAVRARLSEAEQKFDTSSAAANPMRDLAAQIDNIHAELTATAATSATAAKDKKPATKAPPASGRTGPTYTPVSVSLDQIRSGAASLRIFQRASAVSDVQTMLRNKGKLGIDGKPLAIDQLFGPNTEFAVKAFQLDSKLPASGVVDKATIDALEGRTAAGGTRESSSGLPVGAIAAGVGALVVVGLLARARRK
jgi:murein L,D-transpeptidase YcbB/YkuD